MIEPFIFPFQVTQVLFLDDLKQTSWKVVLRKEARSRIEVANIEDVFMTTIVEAYGLSAPIGLFLAPNIASFIGAIELSEKDKLLAFAKF
jgi:hypothetical protein